MAKRETQGNQKRPLSLFMVLLAIVMIVFLCSALILYNMLSGYPHLTNDPTKVTLRTAQQKGTLAISSPKKRVSSIFRVTHYETKVYSCPNSQNVSLTTLHEHAFIVGSSDGAGWVEISYPFQYVNGWVQETSLTVISDENFNSGKCIDTKKINRPFKVGEKTLGFCLGRHPDEATLLFRPADAKTPISVTLDSGSWQDQSLIGAQGLGALVGGGLHTEVIPVSTGAFFSISRSALTANRNGDGLDASRQAFTGMREALMRGDIMGADKMSKTWHTAGEGQFEYIADLALSFSAPAFASPPIQPPQVIVQGPHSQPMNELFKVPTAKAGLATKFISLHHRKEAKRRQLLAKAPPVHTAALKAKAKTKPAVTRIKQEVVSNEYLQHISFLDMEKGLATSQLLDWGSKTVHTREWFVSAEEGVLTGHISSSSPSEGIHARELSVHVKVTRPPDPMRKEHPVVKHSFRSGRQREKVQKRTISIGPSVNLIVPHAVMCVTMVCSEGQPVSSSGGEDEHGRESQGEVMECEGGQTSLYVAIEKEEFGVNDNSSRINHHKYDISKINELETACWHRLEAYVELPRREVLKKQKARFGEPGAITKLHLHNKVDNSDDQDDSSYSRALVTETFNMGRYLMLASSGKYVSNLQGIWADGPRSAWAGDYHLNINFQMMHWAPAALGLGKRFVKPLLMWLKRLRAAGARTAQKQYNCRGWVAHGFLDEYFDAGTAGDYHWALCVTCGAWAALSLWEYSTFLAFDNDHEDELRNEALQALAGVIDFFLDYLVEDSEGLLHTGPTTSPENSYLVQNPAVRPTTATASTGADHTPVELSQPHDNDNLSLGPELQIKPKISAKRALLNQISLSCPSSCMLS